ncbi:MAG: hypothetical protein ABIZ49_06325, partial [Opitutaceae bacterium]
MERHFILPATLAAALHAGLLFGYRPTPTTTTVPPKEPPTDAIRIVMPIEVEATIIEVPPDTPRPKGPLTPQPADPEIFQTLRVDTISIPVSNPPRISIDRSGPLVPIGAPDGADAIGPHIFTPTHLDNQPRIRSQVAPQFPFDAKKR